MLDGVESRSRTRPREKWQLACVDGGSLTDYVTSNYFMCGMDGPLYSEDDG